MRHRYAWDATAHLDDVAPASLPPWAVTLVTAPRRSLPGREGTVLRLCEGERNVRLFQLGCALRRYGVEEPALRGALEAVNRVQCVPPLEPGEVAKIAASATRYTPPARCDLCGAPLPQDDERRGAVGDEDALIARALGVR